MTHQTQKAGKNSEQFQIGEQKNFFIHGIDEKRVREVFDELLLSKLETYLYEARLTAENRVNKLADEFLAKFKQREVNVQALKDPDFQMTVVGAQKTAATTEREADYDTLAQLLADRSFEEDRITRTGIKEAIKVVGDVSEDALLGLSVYYALTHISFPVKDLDKSFEQLDLFFDKIIVNELPKGIGWIEHLEQLSLIQANIKESSSRIINVLQNDYWGYYIEVGIRKGSNNHQKAIEILEAQGLNSDVYLADHFFNPDYILINTTALLNLLCDSNVPCSADDIEEKRTRLRECNDLLRELYEENDYIKRKNEESLIVFWNSHPSLLKISEWMSNISVFFKLSMSGQILANTYIRKTHPNTGLYRIGWKSHYQE